MKFLACLDHACGRLRLNDDECMMYLIPLGPLGTL